MAATTVIVTLLILTCHVALVMGFYNGPMWPADKAALEAVKAAFVNGGFPTIECSGGKGDIFSQPFRCTDTGRLYSAYLFHYGFVGSIAPEIGNLKSLAYMDLGSNQLSGSIPSSIGKLTSLEYLSLADNNLSGSIPPSVGNLTSLVSLYLANNQLSGSVPSSIGKMKSLQSFYIKSNFFTGPISRVQGHPACFELSSNCLFNSSLPKGCAPKEQKSTATCKAFCNATQPGGPCGGGGICSNGTKGPSCACSNGYNNKANKFTCKLVSPPPRHSPPPSPHPKFPPPRPRTLLKK